MKVLRFLAAIPATILFVPFAFILCCFVGVFILLPEMVSDIFEDLSGRYEK